MIEQSDIIADMHIHTIFSKHAYSTFSEILNTAQKRNLKYLAITDHLFQPKDDLECKHEAIRIQYLEKALNSDIEEHGINIIGGAEFNLREPLKYEKKLKYLKWKPVGLHNFNIDISSLDFNDVIAFIETHFSFYNALAHIERDIHKLKEGFYGKELTPLTQAFFITIIDIASTKDLFIEVNESSLRNNEANAVKKIEYYLKTAKNKNIKIYLGSDAHYHAQVGKFPLAIKLLNEIEYPKELILNCNEDLIKEIINKKGE